MNSVLSIILLVLLILITGKRGIKTFLTIYFNLALIFIIVILVGWGFNPLIPTFVICLIISVSLLLSFFHKRGLVERDPIKLIQIQRN